MEIVTITITKELLQSLVDSEVLTTDDFKVKFVDVDDFDYSDNLIWKSLKEKSDKAFKELKIYEFKIRNKIII